MAEAIESLNNDGNSTLFKQESRTEEVMLDLQKYLNFSADRKPDLIQTIQGEPSALELQLYRINLRLKSNQEKVLLKKSQNDEIKTIIDYYNLISEKKSVSRSTCTCSNKCTAF